MSEPTRPGKIPEFHKIIKNPGLSLLGNCSLPGYCQNLYFTYLLMLWTILRQELFPLFYK